MKFTPKTEDEIARENLLAAGEYDFEVVTAEDKTSKAGNDMIEITMKVFRPDGGFVQVRDYLMEKIAYKLRHFCKASGLLPAYEAGTLTAADCVGRSGKVKLVIKEQEGYQARNEVKDYVIAEGAEKHIQKAAPAPVHDDSGVPF